ncbi:MAG: hypothetical protein IJ729_07580, partial [Alloprevotella sp.]|nr:hypothetical protein [Alloprevotella sp.]
MNKHLLINCRHTGLLLAATLLSLPAMRAQEWFQTEFLIGTYYDPPVQGVESEEEVAEQYRRAREAGFNLLTNRRITHGYGTVREAKLQELARRYGFKMLKKDDYLSRTPAKTMTRDAAAKRLATKRRQGTQEDIYGYDLMDEPRNEEDKARIRNVMAAAREECPDKPFLVNLLPSYGFPSWEEFRNYAESYASADMGLQLLCFDNYFPQSLFQNPPSTRYSYFSDLALLRRLAGNRPLWSYVITRQRVKRMAEPQQRAFMWLSAFAPLAYGAKGLLYFTYDRFEAHEVRRNLNYHAQPAWNQPVYYQAGGEPFHTFVCQLRDNTAGFADIATYTPHNGGTWYVKYAKEDRTETTRSTDRTLHGAGRDVLPLTGDLNLDGTDELLTIGRDGTLHVLHHDCGTAQTVLLAALPSLPEAQGALVCDVDGNRRAELLLQIGQTTHIYWDYDKQSHVFARKTEQALPAKALQLLAADGTAYALTEKALYQVDKKVRWKELRTL